MSEQTQSDPEEQFEIRTVQSKYQRLRLRTGKFLESQLVHRTVILLVAIDTILVLVDLCYTFLSPQCHFSLNELESPVWLEVLSYISLGIASFFLLEIPLNIWSFGLQYINPFGHVPFAWLHLFDLIVIITTFVLEVILRGKERELASLLIIFRLWRLVKLAGGVTIAAGEIGEENSRELEITKAELLSVKEKLKQLESENKALRKRISQRSSSDTLGQGSYTDN